MSEPMYEEGSVFAGFFGLAEEPGWQERALCAQTDPEAFFPEKGGSTREAKRICTTCEVRAECLEYELEHDERFGIWGGCPSGSAAGPSAARVRAGRAVQGLAAELTGGAV